MGRMSRVATHKKPEPSLPISDPQPFRSVDDLLIVGRSMLEARARLAELLADSASRASDRKEARRAAGAWEKHWHCAVPQSADAVAVARRMRKARLSRVEREIVLVLLLNSVGLLRRTTSEGGEIIQELSLSPRGAMAGMRALCSGKRLYRTGFLIEEEPDAPPARKEVSLDPLLMTTALTEEDDSDAGWPVKRERELYGYLEQVLAAAGSKTEAADGIFRRNRQIEYQKFHRKLDSLIDRFLTTTKAHPEWAISRLIHGKTAAPRVVTKPRLAILLTLLAKELSHSSNEHTLFKGSSLSQIASSPEMGPQGCIQLLRSDGFLRRHEFIQPSGGVDPFLTDNPAELQQTEFEVTPTILKTLGLADTEERRARDDHHAGPGNARLDQLVLSPDVHEALDTALVQARHGDVLMNTWGFADRLSYGRGVTLLFWGPPGTGKTAAAEAVAGELDRPLLVADYSKLQNCLVGQTEKNIARIFREARQKKAVLLWDEADAMFFDRDVGAKTWEVRDVNVLLQELERFDGVCILATNRLLSLDKALDRRISARVEFRRPDKQARREIFRRIIPSQLPLAADVSIDILSENDLSGGEIKNVVLNAARIALRRAGATARVRMDDFRQSLALISQAQTNSVGARRIGFQKTVE